MITTTRPGNIPGFGTRMIAFESLSPPPPRLPIFPLLVFRVTLGEKFR